MITSVEPASAATRRCTMEGGGTLNESIMSVDDLRLRVAYTINDSPSGSTHQNASLQALADGTAVGGR